MGRPDDNGSRKSSSKSRESSFVEKGVKKKTGRESKEHREEGGRNRRSRIKLSRGGD